MGTFADAEFEARIESRVKLGESLVATLPTARDRKLALQLASNTWGIVGLCAAQLRRYADARDAFRKSAVLAAELLQIEPSPWRLRNALELALTGGDRELQSRILASGIELRHTDFAPLASSCLQALIAVLQGDHLVAQKAAEAAIRLDETATKCQMISGLGHLFRAINEEDATATESTLAAVLDRHVRLATRGHLKGLDSGLLCVPALSAGIAAVRAGLPVTVASEYHCVKLPRIATLDSWAGEPTAGRRFDAIADICPAILLAVE